MTQEKIEQLAEQICSEFVTDKDTTATFGVDFDRKDIVNALIAMADEVIENIIKEIPNDTEVEEQVTNLNTNMKTFDTIKEFISELERRYGEREEKNFVQKFKIMQEFVEKCPKQLRYFYLLQGYIQFAEHFDWNEFDGDDWANLLAIQPQYEKYCNWKKLKGNNWCYLLTHQPQFSKHCYWQRLNGYDWVSLLDVHPKFAKHCKWSKLNKFNWERLLRFHPEFIRYCSKKMTRNLDWNYIIAYQPLLKEFYNKNIKSKSHENKK